jgi:hypothetical protein
MNPLVLLYKKNPSKTIAIIKSGATDRVKAQHLDQMFLENFSENMTIDTNSGETSISMKASYAGKEDNNMTDEIKTPIIMNVNGEPDAEKSKFPWGEALGAAGGILGLVGGMFDKSSTDTANTSNTSNNPDPEEKKNDNTILYIGVAIVFVLGVVYFMTKGGLKKTN